MPAVPVPSIAIVGGGPCGLVLLLTLAKRGAPAVLYERDSGPFSRAHLGGTLDLGWAAGQRALRENGLEEALKTVSRPEGDEYKIGDEAGNILFHCHGVEHLNPQDIRPEIDRTVLRKLLLDAVPADAIKWGHTLASVRPLGGGKHELIFSNGTTATCDILVGADGAHSRVRSLVSPARA